MKMRIKSNISPSNRPSVHPFVMVLNSFSTKWHKLNANSSVVTTIRVHSSRTHALHAFQLSSLLSLSLLLLQFLVYSAIFQHTHTHTHLVSLLPFRSVQLSWCWCCNKMLNKYKNSFIFMCNAFNSELKHGHNTCTKRPFCVNI